MHGPTVTEGTLRPYVIRYASKEGLKRKEDGTTELEELRRQLKELLDAGFIQPSKAPYGARDAFRLTNAPATFCTLMNKIFHPYLDKFVVNKLYVKKEKCSFAKEEVSFLGHRIRDGKLMMDDSKVKAIQEWDPPTKNKAWEWNEMCQQAFEDLKKAVTEEPVLVLPDHTKVFEVHTDASDFAIGGVLMQERNPIAFESRKLNDTERRYTLLPDTEEANPKQASRKAELASITSQPQGDIMDLLREGLQHDPVAKSLITLAMKGRLSGFGGMAYSTPRGDDLRA
ncbi:hypothetical protein CK203_056557 [Vitis vinifera]|uniref:Reverse transcriptase/retrotransposon-derived protein RNase H-like domain-containing protein n=1 Tax=Vitis vinifera TaxID=29760 RepID=A0A438GKB3_VITVI|nr:hypothetical protein CK203_056557 [Vitis vinifera]